MREWKTRHADEDELWRLADGELSARESARVRAHLASCWQCRADLEALEQTIGECVRYRKQVLQTYLPSPPQPWPDLSRRFDEADRELAAHSRLVGLGETVRRWMPGWKHLVPAAAALVLAFGLIERFRWTPAVEASSLLQQAAAAADGRPRAPRRLEIRTRSQRVTRTVPIMQAAARDDLAAVSELFAQARYDFSDPLSARAFLEWRARLPEKQDRVARIEEQGSPARNRYRILTTTRTNAIRQAALELRMADLYPLQATLRFHNEEWVELSDLPGEPAPATDVRADAARTGSAASSSAAPAEAGGRLPDAPLATPAEELQVLAALHRLGADLGEPVEVNRAGAHIVVSGLGVEPERQRQIEAALRGLPKTVLRFGAEHAEAVREDPAVSRRAMGQSGDWPARLEDHAGGRAQVEQLAAAALEQSEQMMARAFALRRLAERFPPAAEAQLGEAERRLLRGLLQDHAAALHWRVEEIQRTVRPALSALGVPHAEAAAPPLPGDWQSATRELFARARRVEQELAALLAGAPPAVSPELLPSSLSEGLETLRAGAAGYVSLVAP
jgi:hypothetical protein